MHDGMQMVEAVGLLLMPGSNMLEDEGVYPAPDFVALRRVMRSVQKVHDLWEFTIR